MGTPLTDEQTATIRRAAALIDYHCQVLAPFEVELIDSMVDRWRDLDGEATVTAAEWPALEAALQAMEADRARQDDRVSA